MSLTATDERHLRTAIELALLSRENGNHPFGSLLTDADDHVVLEAENNVVTGHDVTGHAELNLVRAASARFDAAELASTTLYTSTEPCAMCAGAIYWSGIGRVVFALSSTTFQGKIDPDGAAGLALSSRDVFARGGRAVEVTGPHLEDLAWAVHEGFWQPEGT
jgi:tRNA(Arg) A34 adenosine deaminase TadA